MMSDLLEHHYGHAVIECPRDADPELLGLLAEDAAGRMGGVLLDYPPARSDVGDGMVRWGFIIYRD
jgi:hypothetical protein